MNSVKRSLVVGGSRGIGREITRTLSAAGHEVHVLARAVPPASVRLRGVRYHVADLSDPERLSADLTRLFKGLRRVNHLVFSQRFRGPGDEWGDEMQVTVAATGQIIEAAAGRFPRRGDCSIVAISSAVGSKVTEEQPLAYHAGKAALEHLVRYYAVRLGPRGVRTNAIAPGTTVKEESRRFYHARQPLRRLLESVCPLGRMGTAQDIASAVEFFCSPRSSFINGQVLAVDGGLSVQSHESLARQISAIPASVRRRR